MKKYEYVRTDRPLPVGHPLRSIVPADVAHLVGRAVYEAHHRTMARRGVEVDVTSWGEREDVTGVGGSVLVTLKHSATGVTRHYQFVLRELEEVPEN